MRFTVLPAGLASVFAIVLWQYNIQNNEKLDKETINTVVQKQSQEVKPEEREHVAGSTAEKGEREKSVELEHSCCKHPEGPTHSVFKNSTKQNQRDGLFFKPVFQAFSLDTVFFILLIHICGADLVRAVSAASGYMSSAGVLVELTISLTLAVYAKNKWKREKTELVRKNRQLQEESLNKEKEREDVITTLMEVKTELEHQRLQLKELLQEVEREREVNKKKLQAVETEITERETKFEKPEELLKEKENLLRAQWKLDQTKKDNEKQLLNSERLLEPIEIKVTRTNKMKEGDANVTFGKVVRRRKKGKNVSVT